MVKKLQKDTSAHVFTKLDWDMCLQLTKQLLLKYHCYSNGFNTSELDGHQFVPLTIALEPSINLLPPNFGSFSFVVDRKEATNFTHGPIFPFRVQACVDISTLPDDLSVNFSGTRMRLPLEEDQDVYILGAKIGKLPIETNTKKYPLGVRLSSITIHILEDVWIFYSFDNCEGSFFVGNEEKCVLDSLDYNTTVELSERY